MKGFILAGGKGVRLRPITYEIAKPLLPINGKPIINYLVNLYLSAKIKEIKINIPKKKAGQFFDWKEKYYPNQKISFLIEEKPSGTMGPLVKSEKWFSETIIVSNGDELKDIDLNKFIKWHKKRKALASIALVEVPDPSSYGVVKLKQDKIIDFIEKPKNPPSNCINSGLYILAPKIKKYFSEKDFLMVEKDLFPQLTKKRELYGYKWKGKWQDTGTLERYEKAIKTWGNNSI